MKRNIIFSLSIFIITVLVVFFPNYANALCPVDVFCHTAPPRISDITVNPNIVTESTEQNIDVSVTARSKTDIHDDIYDNNSSVTFDPSITISGNIKDENGGIKASLNSTSVSCTDGNCSYTYQNINVSGWSDGIYTVFIDIAGGNGGTETFEIRKGTSDYDNGPPDVQIETDKSWVYVGDTVNITWNSNNALTCSATNGPGFDTGGAKNGTDESDPLNTAGVESFSVECTQVIINPATGGEITNTASATVDVQIKNKPSPPNIAGFAVTSSRLRKSGDLNVSWNISGADVCSLTISGTAYSSINGTWDIDPNSSGMNIPAEAASYNTNDQGTIDVSLSCSNAGGTTTKSGSATIYHNYVHWYAYVKNNCSDSDSSANRMNSPDEQNIRFDAQIREVNGTEIREYPDSVPNDGDDRTWGKVSYVLDVKPGTTPYDSSTPQKYSYCGYSGEVTINKDIGLPPQEETVKLFFIQGGGTPPSNLTAIGECHQNTPGVQTQVYLTWSPVAGADHYNIYRDSSNIGQTTGISYLDLFNPPQYNVTHEYYVKAVDASGNESGLSQTVYATTPSTCDVPPSGINPTLVVIPSSASINMQGCEDPISQQFNALYDPDGPDSRYGEFNINSSANWSSSNTSVASSQGDGLFNGISSGSASVMALYDNIDAYASLDVNSCTQPDFSISISPSLRNVDIAGGNTSTTYTITISPLNEFSGDVSLSISNLLSPMSGSFNPQVVLSGSGNSTLMIIVPDTTNTGRSTFIVTGTSGNISHNVTADINIIDSTLPFPTATLTADPSTIVDGESSTLYWSATDASHCEIDQGVGTVFDNGVPSDSNGSEIVTPTVTTTYTLTCSNSNGNAQDSATVTVTSNPPPPGGNGLSCSVSRSPASGSTPLNVVFNITASNGTPSYQYRLDPSDGTGYSSWGSVNTISYTYDTAGSYIGKAEVKDNDNNLASCTAPLVVASSNEACDISASPTSILSGQSSLISWYCSNPSQGLSCQITDLGNVDPSGGSERVKLTTTKTFVLTCNGNEKDSVTIKVGFIPVLREILPRW